jgi:hypothetical protein
MVRSNVHEAIAVTGLGLAKSCWKALSLIVALWTYRSTMDAMNLNVWEGVKHGIDIHNIYFQIWFFGTPIVWFLLLKVFRALDWWKFPTRKGTRTSDIMAFEFVAGISVAYLGGAGLIISQGWFGTAAELARLNDDMLHTNSDFVINHLVYPMVTFQLWNVLLCLFTPDLNVPEMLGHHLVTAALGYFGMHPYLHGYGLFFFGVAELTNVPLTVYDMFKYMKAAKWQEKYSFIFTVSKLGFAASFVVLRIVVWPMISYPFWKDSVALLQSGKAHSNFVVGFFLLANVFLTFLQFFWGWKIVESVLPKGAAKTANKDKNDERSAVPTRSSPRTKRTPTKKTN